MSIENVQYQGLDTLVDILDRRQKEIDDDLVTCLGHQYLEETEVHLRDGPVVYAKQDLKVAETGGAVWEGAIVMAEFFAANPSLLFDNASEGKPARARSIIELGSGTGFCGTALRCLQRHHAGSISPPPASDGISFIVSDCPPNVPLMQSTIVRNATEDSGLAVAHPWGEDIPEESPIKPLIPFDLIIGTDLLYNPDSMDDLLKSLLALSGPQTQIFLCWKERFSFVEQGFLKGQALSHFNVEEILNASPKCLSLIHI